MKMRMDKTSLRPGIIAAKSNQMSPDAHHQSATYLSLYKFV